MRDFLATAAGSAPALIDAPRQETWSYDRLREAVGTLAGKLDSGRKSLVFVYCRNSPESVAAYLGSLAAGHAVALLDPGVSAEFQGRLLDLYQPDFVFHPGNLSLPELDWVGCGAAGEQRLVARREPVRDRVIHLDLAVLLSTSGSTGSPKLVRLSHEAVLHNAGAIREALDIEASERPISSLPLYYSYGLSVLNSHFAAGAAVVLTDAALTTAEFWQAFRECDCTSLAGVPYSYQLLRRLDIDQLKIPSLKTLTQAGGRLNTTLIGEFHQKISRRGGLLYVMYGQTEATARISVLPPASLPDKLGSVGLPLRGGAIDIEAGSQLAAQADAEGALVYRGPNVMMGYALGPDDLALGDVQDGRLETGDIGCRDADGFYYITGRLKRIAKVFGLRLSLDEVEDLLKSHGPVAVLGGEDRLTIFCEFGDDGDFGRLTDELSEKLQIHRSALRFRRLPQLPMNANGKTDYPELARLL